MGKRVRRRTGFRHMNQVSKLVKHRKKKKKKSQGGETLPLRAYLLDEELATVLLLVQRHPRRC